MIISGRVNGEFEAFMVNGQVKFKGTGSKITRFSFKEKLHLNKMNQIRLEVSDNRGNQCKTCTKMFEITRHPAPEEIRDFRATVAICPLARDGGDREITENLLWDLIEKTKKNGRFRILATDEDIRRVAEKEKKMTEDGWIDTASAARFAQALDAEYSIACTIRPTANDVEIYARLIDSKTKEILATCDVYDFSEEAKDFDNAYSRFVEKLVQTFPIVSESSLTRFSNNQTVWHTFRDKVNPFSQNKTMILGMGADTNIKKGMKFVAYYKHAPQIDGETGNVLIEGKINRVGEFVAKMVGRKFSHLKPLREWTLLKLNS